MNPHTLLITLHVLAAALWVGGMATVQLAVRPAILAVLHDPGQRQMLMASLLQKFFGLVLIAIAVLLLSGLAMIGQVGSLHAYPASVHAMIGLGVLMMVIFGHLRWALFPRLQRGVKDGDKPVAAKALNSIRLLVSLNLVLGVLAFGAALLPHWAS
jgi:uncharacterized membrane protein